MVVADRLISKALELPNEAPSNDGEDLSRLGLGELTMRYRRLNGSLLQIGERSLDLCFCIGETLERVRATVGKGKWLGWCENEDLEVRTAQRYIKFREKVGTRDTVSRLPADCGMRGAMALLAEEKLKAPHTPGPVFPVATPADVVIDELDAGAALPDRIIRAIRRSRSEAVDLVLTSWPYCLGQDSSGYVDYTDYAVWLKLAHSWADTLEQVLAPNGRAVINLPLDVRKGQPRPRPIAFDAFRILGMSPGLRYATAIVWVKSDNGHRSNTVKRGSVVSPNAPALATGDELLLVFHKGEWSLGRAGEPNDLDRRALEWTNAHWIITGKSDREYPHVFPDELVSRCISLFSFPGDLVADFHCGSGQVAVGALKLGRKFVGGDINPRAVALSTQRVQAEWVKRGEQA